jgi:hypothetical protein
MSLLIISASSRRGRAASMVRSPVRNTAAPMPAAPTISPVVAVPPRPTAPGHQLDRRADAEFRRGRLVREKGAACTETAAKASKLAKRRNDYAHFSLSMSIVEGSVQRGRYYNVNGRPNRWTRSNRSRRAGGARPSISQRASSIVVKLVSGHGSRGRASFATQVRELSRVGRLASRLRAQCYTVLPVHRARWPNRREAMSTRVART